MLRSVVAACAALLLVSACTSSDSSEDVAAPAWASVAPGVCDEFAVSVEASLVGPLTPDAGHVLSPRLSALADELDGLAVDATQEASARMLVANLRQAALSYNNMYIGSVDRSKDVADLAGYEVAVDELTAELGVPACSIVRSAAQPPATSDVVLVVVNTWCTEYFDGLGVEAREVLRGDPVTHVGAVSRFAALLQRRLEAAGPTSAEARALKQMVDELTDAIRVYYTDAGPSASAPPESGERLRVELAWFNEAAVLYGAPACAL